MTAGEVIISGGSLAVTFEAVSRWAMDHIVLADGRRLDIRVSGPQDGPVLVFHHGTPGSRIAPRTIERVAHEHGLRFVSYSRAGYGGSSPHPGRSVADVVPDIEALLDHLGTARCVTAGWSGGGPHALATAVGLPERVTGCLVIAGVAPHDADGLDFIAGMGQDNVEEFGAARGGEGALRAFLDPQVPQLRGATAAQVIELLGSLLPDVDRAVLTDEVGEDLVASFHDAVSVSADGWVEDDLAFVQHWGFDLDDTTVPTFVWQGSLDLMVPHAHGQWLAAHIPGAIAHLVEGEGHLSIGLGAAPQMIPELVATLS